MTMEDRKYPCEFLVEFTQAETDKRLQRYEDKEVGLSKIVELPFYKFCSHYAIATVKIFTWKMGQDAVYVKACDEHTKLPLLPLDFKVEK